MLITGSNGQVGSHLKRMAEKTYDVVGIGKERHDLVDVVLDMVDTASFASLLQSVRPNVIVHTAALTWVDYSEDHQEETDANNIAPVQTLYEYARNAVQLPHVIFISSDYVYDGKKKKGTYTEEDVASPINYYGISKIQGENIIRQFDHHTIVRPGVVFSWHKTGKNFFMQTYNNLKAGEAMTVVDDQISNPTYAPSLVEAIMRIADYQIRGTFNATGPETVSRYDFAIRIADAFGFDAAKISRAQTPDFKMKAQRPMNCATDSQKLYDAIKWRFPELEENFLNIKQRIHEKKK